MQDTNQTARKKRSRSTGRVTLKDVAASAGVSLITASRALNGNYKVSDKLLDRVKAAAERLNYIPDPVAKALASTHSSSVTVLVPTLTNPATGDVLQAIHAVLLSEGYQILIGDTHYSRLEEERLLRIHLSHRPRGLIVTGFDRSEETKQLIAKSGIPCVHILELSESANTYCVGFDQRAAARKMAEHLLSRGRKRIAFAAALDPRSMLRAQGYREAMNSAGIYDPTFESLSASPASIHLGTELFQDLIRRRPDIDAIFFSNDDLAHGALFSAFNSGIKVPEQIAIAGFNNLEESAFTIPPLTTIHTSRTEIGRCSAKMLLALMNGKPVENPITDVGFELIVRQST